MMSFMTIYDNMIIYDLQIAAELFTNSAPGTGLGAWPDFGLPGIGQGGEVRCRCDHVGLQSLRSRGMPPAVRSLVWP